MKQLYTIAGLLILAAALFWGCQPEKKLSRDELPAIKESLTYMQDVLKAYNTDYLDSILSSDAKDVGTTPESFMNFVYADSLKEFVGFTHRQIGFRGDVARVDCMIEGPNGPVKPVTITLKKEHGLWLFKKIEDRVDNYFEFDSIDDTAENADEDSEE